MTEELIKAIDIIRSFFKNPENFKSKYGKVEGVIISNWLDAISAEFVEEYIRPEVEHEAKKVVFDFGAKA